MPTYFLQCGIGGPIKIGQARNPNSRRGQLQTGNPVELTLLGSVSIAESVVHHRFRAIRIRGEWFRPELELLDYISRHAQ